MTYYLQMDGVDDYLKTPSITFTDIYIDAIFEQAASKDSYYFDARAGGTGYAFRVTAGTDSWAGYTLRVDGVIKTNGTTAVPSNQRLMLRGNAAAVTDDVTIFSRNNAANFLKGKIYSVQFYNGATLVASYDMNTQTVQDQSGNGNHATLTGGTWVNDATGTDVSISSVVATATNNGVTPNVSAQVSKTIVSVTAAVSSQAISPSVSSSNAVSITSAVASVSLSGLSPSVSTGVNITSTLTNAVASAIPPFIGSLETTINSMAASMSSQFMTPNVTIAYEVISVANLEGVKAFIVPLQGSIEQTVQVLGLKDNIVLLEGEI